jgi:hypothetical protein
MNGIQSQGLPTHRPRPQRLDSKPTRMWPAQVVRTTANLARSPVDAHEPAALRCAAPSPAACLPVRVSGRGHERTVVVWWAVVAPGCYPTTASPNLSNDYGTLHCNQSLATHRYQYWRTACTTLTLERRSLSMHLQIYSIPQQPGQAQGSILFCRWSSDGPRSSFDGDGHS